MMQRFMDIDAAEDVAHDAFEEAWRVRRRFDRSRFAPDDWMSGVARHVALDQQAADYRRRGSANHEPLSADAIPLVDLSAAGPRNDENLEIADLLDYLPLITRKIVVLRFWGGFNNREIAVRLLMTEDAVAKRVERALRFLRRRLDDDGEVAV